MEIIFNDFWIDTEEQNNQLINLKEENSILESVLSFLKDH